ncbi:pyridoxal phosphate-dependent transferase [Pseudoneurospora amorphoporcata]|uniref:Pyridoxal phosphate-dependent transferase n=1 Tax=Pseudoneurospora amorphoporcata TaxID=241081 RepID=A0AAN6SGY0_9PEZI|nr:pyridoxal phosphate-dependent transferase [Pseudoneurospora amorphoporcata]
MNGTHSTDKPALNRAGEVDRLIDAVKSLIVPFIRDADSAVSFRATGQLPPDNRNVLVDSLRPQQLVKQLALSLPRGEGAGQEGLLQTIQSILSLSVNTWDQGFMDKLYASTNAVGVVTELLLSVLNTNLHVYQVSPALTVIEKHTAKQFASLFGFTGPRAGGVTCQGGSASNLTSIVIARNALFPLSKTHGNCHTECGAPGPLILLTSAHGHYSVEKAAVTCGFGSSSVWTVPVDDQGRMSPSALRELVLKAKAEGKHPFYVNATAGTTVLGSYDPFDEIADICDEFGMWLHIDGSWGGPAIFSARHKHKMQGSHRARSLTVNPHKMLNVPVTCSFLLTDDVKVFHRANTLPAGYLFHGPAAGDDEDEEKTPEEVINGCGNGNSPDEVWDLADLTLQCGRRGDALKLALSWIYYGAAGFERQIDGAFEMAAYLANLVSQREDFVLVSSNPPPCLQVCFYYAPGGKLADEPEENTRRTSKMVEKLIARGFMVDYAPGDKGSFFRVVVNCQTLRGTVEGLVKGLEAVGKEVAVQ